MLSVLVVDDEVAIRNFLRRRLEGWGFRVREAADAAEALEGLLATPADIAIVDIRMPGHDGLWLLQRIREKWPGTIVIMATGADDTTSIEQSRKLGAVDYVLKPFDRELLHQALMRAIAAARSQSSKG